WCQCYKGKKCPSLSLSALIVGVDKTTVRTLLSELVATKNKLWLDADFFKWLYNYNFSLDLACSEVFTTFLLSELKRGIYNSQTIFVKLLGLLSPEVLPALQNAIEESTVNANFSEELLTVLRFRHALENET
ncbi:MAG: hypothetical protein GQ569_15025, partial [Methylococcaceae bacterium]|nr:hypothetical protein [Methylococcaceae bacterium]